MSGSRAIPDEDLAFCLTADTGRYEHLALLLVRSLRDRHPGARILTFIPRSSVDAMTTSVLDELNRETLVETGPMPLPDYPVSAFGAAWRRGAERFDRRYIVALDSDAVLLNPLTIPDVDADIYAAPAHIGARRYWAADAPKDDWIDLFERHELALSDRRVRGLADRYPTWPPTYNAGVIVATEPEVPAKLLTLTEEILRSDGFSGAEYYSETIALAALAADPARSFAPLYRRHNFMMGGYPYVHDEVEVLHYQFRDTFSTLCNARHRDRLASYGVVFRPRPNDYAIRALSLAVFRAGRFTNYERAHAFADAVQPIFDWNNPDV